VTGHDAGVAFDPAGIADAVARFREPAYVVADARGRRGATCGAPQGAHDGVSVVGAVPGIFPEWLGDRTFVDLHGARFAYVAGEMANGIASVEYVLAAARAGVIGFFGAAGLAPPRVEAAIDRLRAELAGTGLPWGANLIHSPNEPAIEDAVVDLYLRAGVRRVSASAYVALTPAVVRYAASGLSEHDAHDARRVLRRNHLFAKLSHPDVARRFMSPAPAEILDALVARGLLTPDEARLAARVPVAEDITIEADSGGHTDNRPLGALFPAVVSARDAILREHRYPRPIRLGAAGGLGTPEAVAAAFALGAAYVLVGSVNQASVEAGLSVEGKKMLAQATLGDVIMAPAADMFEQGVRVQVLKRGTLFAARAARLYDVYRRSADLDAISEADRTVLEREIFRAPLAQVWDETRAFWSRRDPAENDRAEREPRHKMALVFRSYLGRASRWAIDGDTDRRLDYQIWCGPAMGAFNAWTRGSFLEDPAQRSVAQIAHNLLEGAAHLARAQQLRSMGVPVPAACFAFRPRPLQLP
jgi:trans-AT polyketide synthase/acyltransferase/oxidoreductase domain-containing protein